MKESHILADNITYYKCDVSKWEEVEAVAKTVQEEVRASHHAILELLIHLLCERSVTLRYSSTMQASSKVN